MKRAPTLSLVDENLDVSLSINTSMLSGTSQMFSQALKLAFSPIKTLDVSPLEKLVRSIEKHGDATVKDDILESTYELAEKDEVNATEEGSNTFLNTTNEDLDTMLFEKKEFFNTSSTFEVNIGCGSETCECNERVDIPSALEFSSALTSPSLQLPTYLPPLGLFAETLWQNLSNTGKDVVPPTAPVAKTNTLWANYLHKLYVYEQYMNYKNRQTTFVELEKHDNLVEVFYSAASSINSSLDNIRNCLIPPPPKGNIPISASEDSFEVDLLDFPTVIKRSTSTISKVYLGAERQNSVTLKHNYNPCLSRAISQKISQESYRKVNI